MMACVKINQILLIHRILVAFIFFILWMNATVDSSGSEMVTLLSNTTTVNRCIETEREALLLIKRSFIDIRGLLSSWGSPQEEDCCQWIGVGCKNRQVTHLNLSYIDYNLSFDGDDDVTFLTLTASNISRSLLELKNLEYLDLSWNYFGELPIPKFIGSLSNLVYLDLSNANLGGAIPDEVGNLSMLNHLDLSSNSFISSPMPNFITSLYRLRYLCLSNNQFSGAIPHELGNLSKLYYLDLSSNSFDSSPIPKLISSFSNLTFLALSNNQFVGAIPNELGNLSKLQHLDLSYNNALEGGNFGQLFRLSSLAHLDVSGINIADANIWLRLMQRLPSLSVLRLNNCNLNSTPSSYLTNSSPSISTLHLGENQLPFSIFNWLSYLSASLVDLDLSDNQLKGKIPESLADMTAIKSLDLSGNQLDGVVPTNSFRNLSSLQYIDFSYNNLSGNLQDILYALPEDSLQVMSIFENQVTGSFPDITRFSSLRILDVSYNQLSGHLPEVFEPSSTLMRLDLSNNNLTGPVPSFTGFSNLRILFLYNNKFVGSLPDFIGLQFLRKLYLHENNFSASLPSFVGLHSLMYLWAHQNEFSGNLPDFTGLQSLTELYLHHNKFSGSLPDFTGCSSLVDLQLEENQITEWKTQSIGKLARLYSLDLSKNSIHSTITESQLSNLSNLHYLSASFNSLTFNLSSGWLPPFQLTYLSLASCKLGPKFPNWIQNQVNITRLDFSNNQISDTIPSWFWNMSSTMTSLDLSFNKIRGKFSAELGHEVDLSSNYFEGKVPLISSVSLKINLSKNKFSGELFTLSAVEDMALTFLDCSDNLLFGMLPSSWVHFPQLVYLNIGYNNFSGMIPMSIGYLISLQTLILRSNRFYGGFPDSLRNCSRLGFADFGLNNLSGKIPDWIGEDLPQLYALILKSNKLYGLLPYSLCHLSNLQFLDLSLNIISGTVPPCFGNFTSMIQNGTEVAEHRYEYPFAPQVQIDNEYFDNALAIWKGNEFVYGKNFAYLKMIDLSSNALSGEFPIGITRLLDIKGLNISRNKFHGKVPEEIGRLKMLESLDLSRNRFSGEIPRSMSGLFFLGYLDLSSNNFSGKIPSGTQLQGFNVSVYEMNVGLCGPPLKKICPGDEADVEVQPSPDGNEADEDDIEYERWLYISAAIGFSTTFWGICGTLVLSRRWRHAYFVLLKDLKDRLYVIIAVHLPRFSRNW